MESKIELILTEIIKINSRINDISSDVGKIYLKIEDLNSKINRINRNLEDVYETNRYIGNYFQGHNDRLTMLEAAG